MGLARPGRYSIPISTGGSAWVDSGVSYSRPALAASDSSRAAFSRNTIEQTLTSGVWLARFHLFGDDYDEILEPADGIRGNLLERPAKSPEPEPYAG